MTQDGTMLVQCQIQLQGWMMRLDENMSVITWAFVYNRKSRTKDNV